MGKRFPPTAFGRYIRVQECRGTDGVYEYYVTLDVPYYMDYLCGRTYATEVEAVRAAWHLEAKLNRVMLVWNMRKSKKHRTPRG